MFTGELRPYQVEAVDKAVERLRVLVAYDLGTGKTPISIAAMERLMDDPESGVYQGVVVCPGSLRWQWRRQILKFTDADPSQVLVVDGIPAKRKSIYASFAADSARYMVVSYDSVMRDIKEVEGLPIDFLVLDEASYVKNFRAKRSQAVKRLRAPVRIGLTGTPVENARLEEYFSVMEAVDHTVLGPWFPFDRRYVVRDGFGGVKYYKNVPEFVAKMKPALTRKRASDPDVAEYLPEVQHDVLPVPMDRATSKVHAEVGAEIRDLCIQLAQIPKATVPVSLNGPLSPMVGLSDSARGLVSAISVRLTFLRLLTTDPELLSLSESDWIRDRGASLPHLPSIKRAELVATVRDLLESDPKSKVVVFTSFAKMVPLLVDALLPYTGVSCLIGNMPGKERDHSIESFRNTDAIRVFVATDAGGFGLDLPEANFLINYDLPWSSGKWTQRNGRIVRASSLWPTVQRWDLLLEGSIDGYIRDVLLAKARAVDVLVDGKTEGITDVVTFSPASLAQYLSQI